MTKKPLLNRSAPLLISVGLYLLIDIPFRATGFPLFTGYAGPKNFLPVTLGALLGPLGALGSCLGAFLSASILGAAADHALFEAFCCLLMGCGCWLLWYCGNQPRPLGLKRWRDLLRLMLCVTGLSVLCALGGLVIWDDTAVFMNLFLSFMVWNILLSVPNIILATSILGILPVCPPWCPYKPEVDEEFPGEPASLQLLNDRLEALCDEKKMTRRKCFQVQNCIEELLLRILAGKAGDRIRLQVYVSDSVCLWLEYTGAAYNPLLTAKEESREDLMGLLLIKQSALRASYRCRSGVNELHIVL